MQAAFPRWIATLNLCIRNSNDRRFLDTVSIRAPSSFSYVTYLVRRIFFNNLTGISQSNENQLFQLSRVVCLNLASSVYYTE